MYSIQLRHPFGLLVSGGTKSGKTTFVKKFLTYVDIMIEKPSENITYYYSEFQNTFGEIQTLVPQIKFVQGLPDDILDTINPETRNLFIVDDMMGEKDAVIAKLFTKKSHHGNLSVIYIVQNLFHHSKEHRTISLNASYLCLTKNVRDASQIVHLVHFGLLSTKRLISTFYTWCTSSSWKISLADWSELLAVRLILASWAQKHLIPTF